ncbi:hypothetical protein E4U09_003035 [Claviceps aff. purpurea]|uniref:SET domain-containing protein n=1 Tax=Claviceps aff. purpurea TaxID=1967640 RepID=A0A9P7U2D3_9HYPO|nr:hypothetical protein E4U09_003035 [Claviceps aff. purpurea]
MTRARDFSFENNPSADTIYSISNGADVPLGSKGLGLAATRHIPKGTRIISEPILISVPKRMYSTEERLKLIDQQLDAMTDDQRESLRHISVYEWFRLPGIERDNSPRHFLPVKELSTMDVIFGDANRINHDCDSNAQHHWNDDIKRLTVHALRDIQPGEEITTSYGSFLNSQNVRRAMFEAMFSFQCSCRLCSLPDNQMQERDRKVAQFTHAERSLQKGSDKHPAFIKLGLFRVAR